MNKINLILILFLSQNMFGQSWITQIPNQGGRAKIVKTLDDGFGLFLVEFNSVEDQTPKLYKYDTNGNFVWVKQIITNTNEKVFVRTIINTSDNGFLLTGSFGFGQINVIIKLDEFGVKEYENLAEYPEIGGFVRITENLNTYTLLRSYNSNEIRYLYLFDKQLNLLEINNTEILNRINDFIYSKGDELFIWKDNGLTATSTVFYTDLQLNLVLENTINFNHFIVCKPTNDNGYILMDDWNDCCFPTDYGNVLKIDENLSVEWSNTTESYLINGIQYYNYIDLIPTQDDGFVFGGSVGNELFNTIQLHKLDAGGNLLWRTGNQLEEYPFEFLYGLVEANDGGLVMFVGSSEQFATDMFLVKTNPLGILSNTDFEILKNKIKIYPNPTKDKLTILFTELFTGLISIYDINGNFLFKNNINNKVKKKIDINNLEKGVYYLVISSQKIKTTLKVLKI